MTFPVPPIVDVGQVVKISLLRRLLEKRNNIPREKSTFTKERTEIYIQNFLLLSWTLSASIKCSIRTKIEPISGYRV